MIDTYLSEQNERLNCNRCYYQWEAKFKTTPQTCPNCRSAYWNKPRVYTEDPTHKKTCTRCSHTWFAKDSTGPKNCPECKSPYWNEERRKKLTTHQRFLLQEYRKVKTIIKLMDDFDGDFKKVSDHINLRTRTIQKKLLKWDKLLSTFKTIPEAVSGGLPSQLGGDDL